MSDHVELHISPGFRRTVSREKADTLITIWREEATRRIWLYPMALLLMMVGVGLILGSIIAFFLSSWGPAIGMLLAAPIAVWFFRKVGEEAIEQIENRDACRKRLKLNNIPLQEEEPPCAT